jgi:hypothetical protein
MGGGALLISRHGFAGAFGLRQFCRASFGHTTIQAFPAASCLFNITHNCLQKPLPGKIQIPALWVCAHQLHLKLITYIHSLLATRQKSFRGRVPYTHENAFRRDACHNSGEGFADPRLERHSRNALIHYPLHFPRRILLERTVPRNGIQLRVRIRRRLMG